jgi:hypothetical protein
MRKTILMVCAAMSEGAYLDFASQGAVPKMGLRSAACTIFAKKTVQDLSALQAGPAVQ